MTAMIKYNGQIAAFAGGRTCHLVPPFDELDAGEPTRRMVELMCAQAMAIERGSFPGPYSDERAARLVRTILIDDEEFMANIDDDDARLADRFGVPIAEIARKRDDLKRWLAPSGRRRRDRPRCRPTINRSW